MTKLADLLKAPFNQADELKLRFLGGDGGLIQTQSEKGICYALCAKWIARHQTHKSEGSQDRIAYLKQENTMVDAMQIQIFAQSNKTALKLMMKEADKVMADVAKGVAPPTGFAAQMREMTARAGGDRGKMIETKAYEVAGLTRTTTDIADAVLDATTLATRVADVLSKAGGTHAYHQLSFRGPGGGHAVCCYKSGGGLFSSAHLYYFDPNRGEYKIKEDLVKASLSEILTRFISGEYNRISVHVVN